MRFKVLLTVFGLLLAVGLLAASACGTSATATPTPTVSPTPTPAPSLTPSLTPTLTPTPTRAATPTPTPSPTPSPFPLTVVDSNGRDIVFDEPPQRIVAIDSAAVEILFAIGEGHRVVGTHDFLTYPPEAADIERIGSAFALNLEKIVELEPDLIYIFFSGQALSDLENLDIRVLYLESPTTLEEVARQFRMWGQMVNQPDAAEELAEQFEESVDDVLGKLAAVDKGPRVFHDEAPGLWTAGSGSLSNEIYGLLKAQNVFGDISGFIQASAEQVVERDPQVVISVYSEGPDLIRGDPAFQGLSAVKEDRLFYVDGDLLSVAGPRLLQGIEQVARFLYPGLFP